MMITALLRLPCVLKLFVLMNKHHDTISMDINVIIVVYSSNETIEDMIPVIDGRLLDALTS